MSDQSWIRAAAYLVAGVLLIGCNDAKPCQNCRGQGEPCATSPVLKASVGDGQVTLTWEPASGVVADVTAWQYRQAVQDETWSVIRNAGPAATVYVVSGLTNGVAYTFQVRSQFGATGFGCWSAAVSMVPRRLDDPMERIEKHQQAISESMAAMVKGMAARQELLEELGEREVAALRAVAASTDTISEHSSGVRDGVERVAANLDDAGESIAAATLAVSQQASGIREEVSDLAIGVDDAGQKVADGLDHIAARLREVCGDCKVLPDNCRELGSVYFGENSPRVEDSENLAEIDRWLEGLPKQEVGLFVTEGYATSVGDSVYNMHLSDQRAACVSRCLHSRLSPGAAFAFREVARGEVLDISDLEGMAPRGRRVDVTFCKGYASRGQDPEKRDWPSVDECGCSG